VGEYKDLAKIGRGGFAEVWHCTRDSDGAHFARKLLDPSANSQMIERFQQEVRILSKLDHPNIVKVLECNLIGSPYWYVMPLYKMSLRDELPRVIGDQCRTQKIFNAILDAVEYAHKEGVIHRDLKPHNVMMNGDDDLVVADFGIGRVLDADGDRFTRTGQKMGSSFYASPEQFTDAKHVDSRSDIYNLGRMLYELHTERLNTAVQDLNRLPPHVSRIVERCTQHLPKDRFESVSDLKDAWRAATQITSLDSDKGEARRLIGELLSAPKNHSHACRLLDILVGNVDDRDLLRDGLMEIPPMAIANMLTANTELTRLIVRVFIEHVLSQSWGASYLDKLGARCSNLFVAINDSEIRAELLYCNLIVGVFRRRYSVLEALAHLLQSIRNHADIKAIFERLNSVDLALRIEAGKWLELQEMDPKLASLFQP
jgi:serine/threonine protein kinase